MPNYIHTQALVIKRHNYAEADRFVTLLTPDCGKISGLAKGVRKLSSRKRTALEPFNHIKVALIESSHGYIITEATVETGFVHMKQSLIRLTQATQFIEIVEGLIAESQPQTWLYHQTLATLKAIEAGACDKETQLVVIKEILVELGFGVPMGDELLLRDYIEEISQKPLRSKHFYLGLS